MRRKNRIVDLFPLLLFLIFTLSALGVVIYSVQIYQHIVETAEGSFDVDTSVYYITEKLRNHDADGSIKVGDFKGNRAVILEDNVAGVPYVTYIYAYDGYLRELYAEREETESMVADSGTRILEITEFDIKKISDDLLLLGFTSANGDHSEAYISVRSKGGDSE